MKHSSTKPEGYMVGVKKGVNIIKSLQCLMSQLHDATLYDVMAEDWINL